MVETEEATPSPETDGKAKKDAERRDRARRRRRRRRSARLGHGRRRLGRRAARPPPRGGKDRGLDWQGPASVGRGGGVRLREEWVEGAAGRRRSATGRRGASRLGLGGGGPGRRRWGPGREDRTDPRVGAEDTQEGAFRGWAPAVEERRSDRPGGPKHPRAPVLGGDFGCSRGSVSQFQSREPGKEEEGEEGGHPREEREKKAAAPSR